MRKKLVKTLFDNNLFFIESIAFACFIVIASFINRPTIYVIAIGIYSAVMLLLTKDILKSFWLVFISLLIFFRARYFQYSLFIARSIQDQFSRDLVWSFFISYSDLLLLPIIVLLRNKIGKIKFSFFDFCFISLILLGFISTYFSYIPFLSWFSHFQFFKYYLIFYLGRFFSKKYPDTIKKIIEFILIFVLLNSLLIILQKILGRPLGLAINNFNQYLGRYADENLGVYRPGGMFVDPNLAASIIGMFIPFLVLLLLNEKNLKYKVSFSIQLIVNFIALIFTYSRAVWILMIAIILASLLKIRKQKVNLNRLRKMAVVALFVVLAFLPMVFIRLQSLRETFANRGSLSYRVSQVSIAFQMGSDNLFGVGPNQFKHRILLDYNHLLEYFDFAAPHNLLAEIVSGYGFLGLFIFSLLILSYFYSKKKIFFVKSNVYKVGCLISIVAFLTFSQFYPWLYAQPISNIFWLIMGISYEK
jgi:O-antigen ligase